MQVESFRIGSVLEELRFVVEGERRGVGEAGLKGGVSVAEGTDPGEVRGDLGTRADEGHVAAEDVHELRELVELPAPEPGADRRDACVRGSRDTRAARSVPHGAELEEREGPPATTDPPLAKEHR